VYVLSPGGNASVVILLDELGVLTPCELVAVTVNVYAVDGSKPLTVIVPEPA
jgi:hypothetical protein